MFKAKAVTNATLPVPGQPVSAAPQRDQTISRLMSLNTFKFVEIRFQPAAAGDSAGRARLDADVLMTQLKKKSLRAEVQPGDQNQRLHRAGPDVVVPQPLGPARRPSS
ncbi:MAG: hypothetical protein WKG07_29730 [Hymenobacter sp.]